MSLLKRSLFAKILDRRPAKAPKAELGPRFESLENRCLLAADVFIDNQLVNEGDSLVIEVSGDLSTASEADRTLFLGILGGGADVDVDPSGTFVLDAKDYGTKSSVTLTGITAKQDTLIEGSEVFGGQIAELSSELSIIANGSTIPEGNNGSATVTIVDDDSATIVVSSSQSFDEATGTASVVVALVTSDGAGGKAELTSDATFEVAVSDGTTEGAADYSFTAPSPDLSFLTGATGGTVTFDVSIVSDRKVEGDEAFDVSLSNLSGATGDVTLGSTEAVTIDDDDTFTVFFTTSGPGSPIVEPAASVSDTATVELLINSTGDGTAADDEIEGSIGVSIGEDPSTDAEPTDFNFSPTSFSLDETNTTGVVTINILGDELVESDEMVVLDRTITGPLAGQLDSYASGDETYTITIEDPDTADLSISSPATTAESGTLDFTVSFSNPVDTDQNIAFSVDAVNDGDFTAPAGTTVFIAAGQKSGTISFAINPDNLVELDETIKVTITDPVIPGVTATTTESTSTITNDDSALVSIAGSPTIDEAAGTATYFVVLNNPSDSPVDVTIDANSGTATAGSDFGTATPSSLTFAPMEQIKPVTVSITDDPDTEGNEDFTVDLTLGSVAGRDVSLDGSGSSATTTILDNDLALVSVPSAVSVDEDAGTVTITIMLDNSVVGDVDVTYATADGTATASSDYVTTAGTATIASGYTSTTVSIPIVNDSDIESSEDFTFSLTGATGLASLDSGSKDTTVTIADDDFSAVSIQSTATVEEGDQLVLTLTRSGSTGVAFDATVELNDGSAKAGSDYTDNTYTVSFGASDLTKTITIDTIEDGDIEGTEDFTALITGVSSGSVAITNQDETAITLTDDDKATVSIAGDTVVELDTSDTENNKATIIFTLSSKAEGDVDIDYKTAIATGDNAEVADFVAVAGGTATIMAGETTTSVEIEIIRDNIVEGDETFTVEMTGLTATGDITLATETEATVTITDDDSAEVTVGAAAVTEGDGGGDTPVTVYFTIGGSYEGTVEVKASSVVGDGSASTDDFTAEQKTITFSGGSMATAIFNVTADDLVEPTETFEIVIDEITGQGTVTGVANENTVTITDDDSATIAVETLSVDEDAGTADVAVTLSGDKVQNSFDFKFSTSDGTAGEPLDYTETIGTFTFKAGSESGDSVVVSVPIVDDSTVEVDETVILTLSELKDDDATHGDVTIGTAAGVLTISDEDSVTVSIAAPDASGSENPDDDAQFVLTLSDEVNQAVVVSLNRAGSATSGSDYKGVSTSVLFAPNQTTAVIDVDVLDDTEFEGDETVELTITATSLPTEVKIGENDSATVNISSDEVDITDIRIRGSKWNAAVDSYSLSDNTALTLPWVNLDTIEVVLSGEPLVSFESSDLTLVGATATTYSPVFQGISGNVATWTVASPIGADILTLGLQGDGTEGDPALDGGDQVITFNVLPGDVNDDGDVNLLDASAVLFALGTSSTTPLAADVDGLGDVNLLDRSAVIFRNGTTLPPPPAPIVAALDSAISIAEEVDGEELSTEVMDDVFASF